jgi:hypothetical protein
MKKTKITNFSITIHGINDTVILECKVNNLPLKEEVIIAQSIQSFNDPEPCMIHRSAVMKKIYVEFLDCFEDSFSKSESAEIRMELPKTLIQKLDIQESIRYLMVKRC